MPLTNAIVAVALVIGFAVITVYAIKRDWDK